MKIYKIAALTLVVSLVIITKSAFGTDEFDEFFMTDSNTDNTTIDLNTEENDLQPEQNSSYHPFTQGMNDRFNKKHQKDNDKTQDAQNDHSKDENELRRNAEQDETINASKKRTEQMAASEVDIKKEVSEFLRQADQKEFPEILKQAKKGDPSAQYKLGLRYQEGRGVEKDIKKAEKWLQKAADQGLCSAQFHLGLCYFEGKDVEKNPTKAFNLFQKAVDQGHYEAQFYLGVCYNKGIGVKQDSAKAVELYRNVAEWIPEAQYNLGVCYTKGDGVKRDYSTALYWLRKAEPRMIATHSGMLLALRFQIQQVEKAYHHQQEKERQKMDAEGNVFYRWLVLVCFGVLAVLYLFLPS